MDTVSPQVITYITYTSLYPFNVTIYALCCHTVTLLGNDPVTLCNVTFLRLFRRWQWLFRGLFMGKFWKNIGMGIWSPGKKIATRRWEGEGYPQGIGSSTNMLYKI